MNEIKCKRTAMSMTQKQLADLLGVEQNTVSQWECGVRFPRRGQLLKLSSILNCTVDELLRNETNSDKEVHLL